MEAMDLSMAQPPKWKTALSWMGALLLALIFLGSGLWKLTDAPGAAVRMAQARVPQSLSLAAPSEWALRRHLRACCS